jgi:hypothetical protein
MGELKMAITTKQVIKIITNKVRLNYVNIQEKRALIEGEEGKYSCQIMIEKSNKELLSQINAAIEEAMKVGAAIWGGAVIENLRTPLRDGDLEELGEEYAGHFYMNLASKSRPIAVDRQLKEIKDPSEIYSGCYARVSFNTYAYNYENGTEGNKEIHCGIGCGLLNIQKLAEGEPLGRTRPEEEFDAVGEEEDILS